MTAATAITLPNPDALTLGPLTQIERDAHAALDAALEQYRPEPGKMVPLQDQRDAVEAELWGLNCAARANWRVNGSFHMETMRKIAALESLLAFLDLIEPKRVAVWNLVKPKSSAPRRSPP